MAMKDAMASLGMILPDDVHGRDAVHVAVFSAVSNEHLFPGQDVGLMGEDERDKVVGEAKDAIGIVDPFLREAVHAGERFWVFLYPRTITSLSHQWAHPAFTQDVPVVVPQPSKAESEAWLLNFCALGDCPSYHTLMEAAARVASGEPGSEYEDDYLHFDGVDAHGEIPPEFWDHVSVVLGRPILGPRAKYFSCSC